MSAATLAERPAPSPSSSPSRRGRLRARLGSLERPLLAAGLALVALHLLDLAISGAHTAVLAVLAIVAVPAAWLAAQPRVIRPTRFALGLVVGLLAIGFGVVSHGLHVINSGLDWRDVTGVGMVLGGLLLVVAGMLALVAPRRQPRRTGLGWRAAHGAGWLAGAVVVLAFGVMPFLMGLMATHAPRWEIQESSLDIPHQEVRVPTADGRDLSAWYVPSRNRAGVLLMHGSGGSRERVLEEIRMLAGHGYGVLALDLPGNGESEGHSNGLGDNAQPAVDAGLSYLSRRSDVDPRRIAGFGSSLGAEVLLEAAAREPRLKAVVSDGAGRPEDMRDANDQSLAQRVVAGLGLRYVRGISGTRGAPSLNGILPQIAPRPVLLIASGGDPEEIPTNRVYRDHGGPTTELWEIPEAGHTGGLKKRPAEYDRRATTFLDRALGV